MSTQSNKDNNIMDSEKKEEKFTYRKKDNYEIDTPEKNLHLINNDNEIDNDKIEKENENEKLNNFESLKINEPNKKKEPKNKNNEDFIIFPKNNENENDDNKIRISNLKDNELPLEDKIQIENQVDNDNDNESEQIEDIKSILNNFGKEKYKNKFLIYKNKNKSGILKSTSVPNSQNNSILNKIKHDIALINFEQEINKICGNYNHDLFIKGEKLNINVISNRTKMNNNKSNYNIMRIENIKKKLFSGQGANVDPMTKSLNNHRRNDNNLYFNNIKQVNNFYDSSNNFYNNKKKQKIGDDVFNEMGNVKEIKINNYNYNQIYNNFYDTFRNKRIGVVVNEKKIITPAVTRRNIFYYGNHFTTDESNNLTSHKNKNNNANLFFYNVFQNSVKKYPNLHLLRNKVNKMKYDDLNYNQNNIKSLKYKDNETIEKTKENEEPKLSILDKINLQKDIFQKEIDNYKKNYLNKL